MGTLRRSLVLSTAVLMVLVPSLPAMATPIFFSASGFDGTGVTVFGAPCLDGGGGTSYHYDYSADLPGGQFSSLPTDLGLNLELHSDVSAPGAAWVDPETSVTLENARGSVRLFLTSGSCFGPTLSFDGTFASGGGTWALTDGTGSYREATGSGAFSLFASVGPGAGNPFSIGVDGQVAVLQPSLAVEVADASWIGDTDPTSRVAAVTYRVSNTGPGDAFGVTLNEAGTSTPGVTEVAPAPQLLGAIAAGEAALFEVRYRFERGPCQLKDRGCALDADLSIDLADALDVAAPDHDETLRVHVPTH